MTRVVIAALLLGVAAGFGFAVTAELVDIVRAAGTSSGFVVAVLATSLPVAAFGGALLGGPLAEILGRRWAMIAGGLLLLVGSLLSALAGSVSDLAFGRMVIGAGVGLAWLAGPLMLSECARAETRGARVTLFFVGWAAGILLLPVLQIFTAYAGLWREAFWLTAAIAAVAMVAAWFCPPSPYQLFMRGDHAEGKALLLRLGWPQQKAEEKAEKITATVRDGERLRLLSPLVRPVLLLTGALMLMDQVTGSSNILFNRSLVPELSANQQYLLVAAANLLTTLVILALIDTVGRRLLLLLGLAAAGLAMLAMAASMFYLPTSLLQAVIMVAAVVAVTLSLGPVAVLLTCELMPLHVRTMAIPLIVSLNFLFDVPVVFAFQLGSPALGEPVLFLAYGVASLVGLALLWRVVPETRSMSLENIERALRAGRPIRSLGRRSGPASRREPDSRPLRTGGEAVPGLRR